MANYPTKESSASSPTSPPSPLPPLPLLPPTPVPPPPCPQPSDCGEFSYCPSDETCCCILKVFDYCLFYCCCHYDVCCTHSVYCCSSDYPICDVQEGLCVKSQGNYLGVAASKRHMAKQTKENRPAFSSEEGEPLGCNSLRKNEIEFMIP